MCVFRTIKVRLLAHVERFVGKCDIYELQVSVVGA